MSLDAVAVQEPQVSSSGIRTGLLPPPASKILRPALPALPPGVERYKIAGGGSIVVKIFTGDEISLIDLEGKQSCEVLTAQKDGKLDLALIGEKSNCKGAGFKKIMAGKEESAHIARKKLKKLKIDLAKAKGLRLFGESSPPRNSADFTVQENGYLLVGAPGGPMDLEKQNTPTPIECFIRRAKPNRKRKGSDLPDPLANPLQDIRVNKSTAEAYLVRAGEYLQIIDVDGRECTDFQCFSARKLDKGVISPLDATTTRSLLGVNYPAPGLPAKGFDQDMDPLVELIRDTCGRHDSFNLACSERYYADMGYPGHVNCTENFNTALEPYGIGSREGWMALNFFYNTGIDDDNVVFLDEPWSRPGDYVLLRALTDIVCVSSACPCDVDAANGWEPTDIHVRTYSDKQKFSRAMAYRMTPDADPELTKETAFHESFAKHTQNFTEYKGYWLASDFNNGNAIDEYWACREAAAIMDLSPLRKFEVTGPDAENLMQYTITRNVRKLAVGQVVYTAMCYEHGGMVDDGTLYRLAENNFRWVCGDQYCGEWLREVAEKQGYEVWVRNSTDQLHNVAVQGPKSRDILKEIIWTPPAQTPLEELGWFRFCVGRIKGFKGPAVIVSRTGYTGELGYEVWCHPKDAAEVFDAVWEAGAPHGLKPLGLDALDMLRIEAGLIFYGTEFCDQTDPFEAGIGFAVPLKSKEDDFIGREALIRRKENPMKKLVGLDIDSQEPVSTGDCVHIGRAQIGEITSSTVSPILKKNIALARLDVTHSEIGTAVEVGKLDGHQKRMPAKVVRFPHYDPDKTRVRA